MKAITKLHAFVLKLLLKAQLYQTAVVYIIKCKINDDLSMLSRDIQRVYTNV